jgi:hypothetical protein
MDDLKALALEKFQSLLDDLWMSDTFVDCIREIYSTTYKKDDQMRETVLGVAHEHFRQLWSKVKFRDLVRENGDFAVDFVDRFSRKLDDDEE